MSWPPDHLCFELVQRDFLGVIDEPMEFSDASLAECLRKIIADIGAETNAGYLLGGIANALTTGQGGWRLSLKKATPGRFISVSEHENMRERDAEIARFLFDRQADGVSKKVAVIDASERFELSRASVFAAARRAYEFAGQLESFRKEIAAMGLKNSLAKKRKAKTPI